MTIRDLHDEHEREFAASALEVLVDQAMGECPLSDPTEIALLRIMLKRTYASLMIHERIEWAARISNDVMTFEDYQARELGD